MELDHSHRRNTSDVHIYSTTADRKAVVYVSAEAVRYVLPRLDLDWSLPLPGHYTGSSWPSRPPAGSQWLSTVRCTSASWMRC